MMQDSSEHAEVYLDRDMTEAEVHPLAAGLAAVYSARAPGKETPNEDAAALIAFDPQSAVLSVADGMGGAPAGEQAAGRAVQTLVSLLKDVVRDDLVLRSAIMDGIESANEAVQALGVGAATTLAVVEIQHDTVRPYHVGDSMILVVGQRGKIKLQTVSHSPVGFGVEAGLIDEAEAIHHEDRHLVSNVLGKSDMRIEVGSTLKLAARDTLLLASDGLFDNLHTEEIVTRLRKGPIKTAAQRLADDGRQRMTQPTEGQPSKPDDLTFVAFRRGRS